jgi:hypothetical protein
MGRISKKIREAVAQRARFCCEYCWAQERYSPSYFSIEHIIPTAKGGTDDEDNLAYACLACNSHKYIHTDAIDPVSGNETRLYHPREDTWNQHFQWDDDYSHITGLTAIGRATIERLRLNRTPNVRLRSILTKLGKHPP